MENYIKKKDNMVSRLKRNITKEIKNRLIVILQEQDIVFPEFYDRTGISSSYLEKIMVQEKEDKFTVEEVENFYKLKRDETFFENVCMGYRDGMYCTYAYLKHVGEKSINLYRAFDGGLSVSNDPGAAVFIPILGYLGEFAFSSDYRTLCGFTEIEKMVICQILSASDKQLNSMRLSNNAIAQVKTIMKMSIPPLIIRRFPYDLPGKYIQSILKKIMDSRVFMVKGIPVPLNPVVCEMVTYSEKVQELIMTEETERAIKEDDGDSIVPDNPMDEAELVDIVLIETDTVVGSVGLDGVRRTVNRNKMFNLKIENVQQIPNEIVNGICKEFGKFAFVVLARVSRQFYNVVSRYKNRDMELFTTYVSADPKQWMSVMMEEWEKSGKVVKRSPYMYRIMNMLARMEGKGVDFCSFVKVRIKREVSFGTLLLAIILYARSIGYYDQYGYLETRYRKIPYKLKLRLWQKFDYRNSLTTSIIRNVYHSNVVMDCVVMRFPEDKRWVWNGYCRVRKRSNVVDDRIMKEMFVRICES